MFENVVLYLKRRGQEYVNKHEELVVQTHLEKSPSRIVESYDAIKLSIHMVSKEKVDQPLTFLKLKSTSHYYSSNTQEPPLLNLLQALSHSSFDLKMSLCLSEIVCISI